MNRSMIKIKNMKKDHYPVGEKALNRHHLNLLFKGLFGFFFLFLETMFLLSVNGEPVTLQ